MTAPGGLPGVADSDDYFTRTLRDLQRQIQELAASVGRNGFVSQGFDGDLTTPAAGTTGWGLGGASGNAVFNNLTLRGGIIGNDALTSPVKIAVGHGQATGFAVNGGVVATGSIGVPAGFTQALVFGTVEVHARNTTASLAALGCALRINTVDPGLIAYSDAAAGTTVSVTRGGARLLTGLSGGTITIDAYAQPTPLTAWTADGINGANVDALAVFLR